LIADNYATLKPPEVKRWLLEHPRFHITEGGFASVEESADTIIAYLAEHNRNPKRYVWKAKGQEILRKIRRARQAVARTQAAPQNV